MIPILTMPHRGPAGPHSMRVKGPRRTHRRADDRLTPHPRRAPLAVAVALALGTGGLEAATFKVTTNADSGAGSLRQAVPDANAAAGFIAIPVGPARWSDSPTAPSPVTR